MRNTLAWLMVVPLAASAAVAEVRSRELTGSFAVGADQTVRLELSVGEFRVEGVAGDKIEAEVRIECRWGGDEECERLLEKVRLVERGSARRRTIEIVSDSSWRKTKLEIEGTFRVPRGLPLEVDMGVGELDIEGLQRDVNVDLGVGEAEIRMDAKRVGTVSLDVGVGEAELIGAGARVEGRRSLLVGSEVHWSEGEGQARVRGDVGVGEITVWLQ